DTGDGTPTVVALVEPPKGEDVAEDPAFNQKAGSTKVSSNMTINDPKTKNKTKPPKEDEPDAKVLTKARPYKLDAFVSERVKEIKALEAIMDESQQIIDQHRGKKTKKPDTSGNGLW